MAHLPDRRLEEVAAHAEQLRVGEPVEKFELDTARVEQRVDQCLRRAGGQGGDHRKSSARKSLAPRRGLATSDSSVSPAPIPCVGYDEGTPWPGSNRRLPI